MHTVAPVCRPGQTNTYNVDRGETANIICEVEANPTPHEFRWKFRSSSTGETSELSVNDVESNVFQFKPQSETDYGSVLCWSINSLGMQTDPCVFRVEPAGKPEQLTNCTIVNQTQESLMVTCIEGFNGGSEQHFIADLYYARETAIVTSISSR